MLNVVERDAAAIARSVEQSKEHVRRCNGITARAVTSIVLDAIVRGDGIEIPPSKLGNELACHTDGAQ